MSDLEILADTENKMLACIEKLSVDAIVKYYSSNSPRCSTDYLKKRSAFFNACISGHINVAKWLYAHDKDVKDVELRNTSFSTACARGHLEVAQWLYELGDIGMYNDFTLRDVAKYRRLDVLKWLHSIGIDIHSGHEVAFREACLHGHKDIIEYIYSIGETDIHVYNDKAFVNACEGGHMTIAQWLYSLGSINIHASDDDAFMYACYRGRFEIAKWLYSLGGVNIHAQNNQAFPAACRSGNIEFAKWVMDLGVDPYKFIEYGLSYDIRNRGHEELANWLDSI